MSIDLPAEASRSLLTQYDRGMPPGPAALPLAEVGRQGWSLPAEDLCLPVLTVSEPSLRHNIETINAYAEEHGVFLCAHGKTMMAPQLLAGVLAGSRTRGLCAATTQQAAVMADCGAANVFIVNQVVGRANLRRLADLVQRHRSTRFLLLVDSIEGLDQLLAHAGDALPADRPLSVLLETGTPQGRAGVRTIAAAGALLEHIARRRSAGAPIRLAGVSCYEGAVPAGPDNLTRVETLFALTRDVYTAAFARGDLGDAKPIISAGGSATFDLAVNAFARRDYPVAPEIWLRPGVAPTYDHVIYQERLAQIDERGGFVLGGRVQSAVAAFRPALALWAAVQSIPDGDVAIVAAGIRDFPNDAGYPTLLAHYRNGQCLASFAPGRHSLTKANDQHGYLPLADLALQVGDVLKFGISHPCTAFDKWRVLFTVDADERVTGAIRTYF